GARRRRQRLVLRDGASGVEEADITATAIAAGGGVGGVEEEIVKLLVRCFYSYDGFFLEYISFI
uniref:Uncharacterized protein n=1 Tax=Oryza glaberrima TaxID=4538 RepID=I1R0R8_ORYGL